MTLHTEAVWVYLAASPLFWLSITLLAYQAGLWLHRLAGASPLVNPVLIAIVAVAGLLIATGTSYRTYFDGAQFVHFLLGPATVALAVPLASQVRRLRRSWLALTVALLTGSLTAAGSAVGIAWALGASPAVLASLAPKSVTTPIAMGIAEQLGGLPTVTAVLVILTGIVGAVFGSQLLRLVRVRDPVSTGFAIGLASHGIGTARAFALGETAGAFSGLAMGLNGLATAILLPLLYALLV
jgi:predicted murein hydrolase (TIGR00659 family)